MELRTAERKRAKIKMALQGPSGSGKTFSALLLAYGLCNNWQKVAVIDTENHSAELFAHVGNFQVVALTAPFTPERYIEAINLCLKKGMEVIIIDSISHEWEGLGGILDIHSSMTGNSYTNWSKLTPRHNAFIQTLLQSPVHVIGNIRSKQDYVLVEKNGKQVPEKVGMKGVQRDGLDYEFTIVLELDMKHYATASKDRTSLFMDQPEFKITSETGIKILNWCNEGAVPNEQEQLAITTRIGACKTIGELMEVYNLNPMYQQTLMPQFIKRRQEITPNPSQNGNSSHTKTSTTWN
ncbi:AAA family ATPase [Segetibacter koreensis]|uniref:AAA family ATPase n=1 Tax=Segetibacter koreensis TaxID=398037 RepID=UPI00035F26E8|nr:AAA family ATPase [Segetibacter koreensis]